MILKRNWNMTKLNDSCHPDPATCPFQAGIHARMQTFGILEILVSGDGCFCHVHFGIKHRLLLTTFNLLGYMRFFFFFFFLPFFIFYKQQQLVWNQKAFKHLPLQITTFQSMVIRRKPDMEKSVKITWAEQWSSKKSLIQESQAKENSINSTILPKRNSPEMDRMGQPPIWGMGMSPKAGQTHGRLETQAGKLCE